MKIIFVNGAPFSGKDTLVDAVREEFPEFQRMMYKTTLYTRVCERYGLTLEEGIKYFTASKEIKEAPSEIFGGKSPREALIYESEEVIKKQYGEIGVALITAQIIKDNYPDHMNQTFIFPDGGFNVETKPMMNAFGLTRKDIFIIRVRKDGCTFHNDSREYLKHPDLVIKNNGSIKSLKKKALKGIKQWLQL